MTTFDTRSGIRERLALLAAQGPKGCEGWTYDPRRDQWTQFDRAGTSTRLTVKQEGSASLELIASKWGLDRKAALEFIGYPDK